MARLSMKLRSVQGGHAHWCPGCEHMHIIPDRWTFSGDVERPTFSPSVRLYGKGDATDCHYILTAGQIQFCADSSHTLAGQTVDLPDIPDGINIGNAGAE